MENRRPKVCKGCSQTDATNFKIAKKQECRSKDVDRVRFVVIGMMRIIENSKSPSFVSCVFLSVGMDNFSDIEDVILLLLRKVIQVKLDKMVIKKIHSQGTEIDGSEWTVMPLSQSTINSQVECGRRKSRVYFNEGLRLPKPLLPPTPDNSQNLDLFQFALKDVLSSSMEIEEVSRGNESEVYLQDAPLNLLHSKRIESQDLDSIETTFEDSNHISVEIEEIPWRCKSGARLKDGVEQKLRSLSIPMDDSQTQNLDSIEIASEDTHEIPINIEDISGGYVESQCVSGDEDYPPKSEILEILMSLSPLENSVPIMDENAWSNSASFWGNNIIQNYPMMEVEARSIINTFEAPVPVYGLMGLFYPVENTVASHSTTFSELPEPGQMSIMTSQSVQHSDNFLQEADFNPAITPSGVENLDCSYMDTPQSLPLKDYPVSKSSIDSDDPTENYPPSEEIVEILHSLGYIPGL